MEGTQEDSVLNLATKKQCQLSVIPFIIRKLNVNYIRSHFLFSKLYDDLMPQRLFTEGSAIH